MLTVMVAMTSSCEITADSTSFIQMTNVRMSKLCSNVRTGQEPTENEPGQSNDVRAFTYVQHLTIDRLQANTQPQWIV